MFARLGEGFRVLIWDCPKRVGEVKGLRGWGGGGGVKDFGGHAGVTTLQR